MRLLTLLAALTCIVQHGFAETPVTISVGADKPGARINPGMWGIFFEDINFGADGGLYAELIKNRSFEFPNPLLGWTIPEGQAGAGTISIESSGRSPNSNFLAVKAAREFRIQNDGFRGIGVKSGDQYEFSALARSRAGSASPRVRVELIGSDGKKLGTANLGSVNGDWTVRRASFRAKATDPKASLQVVIEDPGSVDLDMVSLFPQRTWKERPGGLRADLVQMLADLKPGFVRFPGGCIVEGRYLTNRYQWKTTIGAPEDRKLIINRWNDEFRHRPAPDYYQTFGLGFFEYFQLCEDLGAEPMPILNCGMACQFNSGELAPINELEPYIQDALDLVEFATGAPDTQWGSRRAAMGHPAPFKMNYQGVGNEQWGPQYIERYTEFVKVIKARHPHLQLIASAGPSPADDRFQFLWSKLRPLKADIIDEHVYAAPQWFFENHRRYDDYDRNGPKVFMGEYAAQSVGIAKPENRNNLECALSEAAFMTGLERNGDVVTLASAAPLFGHLDAWQWTPNLIWFDNLGVFGTPNYYVQQLFSLHRGDAVVPAVIEVPGSASNAKNLIFVSASLDTLARQVILKVVNPNSEPVDAEVRIAGFDATAKKAQKVILTGPGPKDENSIQEPRRVFPVSSTFDVKGSNFEIGIAPYSLTVLRIPSAK